MRHQYSIAALQVRLLTTFSMFKRYPELSYSDALFVAGLSRLNDRRKAAMVKLFCEMKNPTHVLNGLLPVRPPNLGVVTRDSYPYELIRGRTARRSRSMIAYCVGKRL